MGCLPQTTAGRTYAAYGGIYIAASLAWLKFVDGQSPDRWDILGAIVCLAGAAIILFPHLKPLIQTERTDRNMKTNPRILTLAAALCVGLFTATAADKHDHAHKATPRGSKVTGRRRVPAGRVDQSPEAEKEELA